MKRNEVFHVRLSALEISEFRTACQESDMVPSEVVRNFMIRVGAHHKAKKLKQQEQEQELLL